MFNFEINRLQFDLVIIANLRTVTYTNRVDHLNSRETGRNALQRRKNYQDERV